MPNRKSCTPSEEAFIRANWNTMPRSWIAIELDMGNNRLYAIANRLGLPMGHYTSPSAYHRQSKGYKTPYQLHDPTLGRPTWFENDNLNPRGPGRTWGLSSHGVTTATRE